MITKTSNYAAKLQKKSKTTKILRKKMPFARIKKMLYLCTANPKIVMHMSDKTKFILKVIIGVSIAALTALGSALGLTSCNVTRTVTTESKYFTHGDTTSTIVTKTIESYDARKNAPAR